MTTAHAGCKLNGRVDEREHHIDAMALDDVRNLIVDTFLGVFASHNNLPHRGNRLMLAQLVAEYRHLHTQLLPGADKLLGKRHTLRSPQHQYVYLPLDHSLVILWKDQFTLVIYRQTSFNKKSSNASWHYLLIIQ